MSHSPTPWIVGCTIDFVHDAWPVFRLAQMNIPNDQKEIDANCALISAAPEMLQMLKDIVHDVGNTEGTLPHKTWREAKALIAKAEGKL